MIPPSAVVVLLFLSPSAALYPSARAPSSTAQLPAGSKTNQPFSLTTEASAVCITERCRKGSRPAVSLSDFLKTQSPSSLAKGLQKLNPSIQAAAGEEKEVLLVEFEPCIFLGPRALNLWAKPKMVLWLRRKGSSLVCEGHVLGAAAADNHPVLVSALDMKARLTASEAPLHHLEGDSVPCLQLLSSLHIEADFTGASGWRRWLPHSLLLKLASRRLAVEFRALQQQVASCLVAEYQAAQQAALATAQ